MSPVIFPSCKLAAHSTEEHSRVPHPILQGGIENSYPLPPHTQFHIILSSALPGTIQPKCNNFYPFLQIFFLKAFLEFMKRAGTGINTAAFRNRYLHWTIVSTQYLSVRHENMAHRCVSLGLEKDFLETLWKDLKGDNSFGRSFYQSA